MPFCCDHSEESCPTTVQITTTSAPSTASVNLDKEKVICSSHPESSEEKQDEKEKDEEKKYDSAVGINIDAVHRAVLRGSIVKLPGILKNDITMLFEKWFNFIFIKNKFQLFVIIICRINDERTSGDDLSRLSQLLYKPL